MPTTNHTTAVTVRQTQAPAYLPTVSSEAIEQAMAIGDLSKMSNEVRVAYYVATCQSAGLNPMTRPFDLIKGDDGTVRLYPNKVAAEQLRKIYRVSQKVTERRMDTENGLYIVTVQASTPDGREDEAQGIVDIFQKKGTALANTLMRCETKAKRRATLSLCGLGYEDSEDAGGHPVRFDYQQGALPDDAHVHTTPARATATLRIPETFQQFSDELYGESRDIPDFTREAPKEAFTPPPLTRERQATPPPSPDAPGEKTPEAHIDEMSALMRSHGESDDAIAAYWQHTAIRCKVTAAVAIKPAWFSKLLDERREYYAKLSGWREALVEASQDVQDADILAEVWAALDDETTTTVQGQQVLAHVQGARAQVTESSA